MPRFKSLKWSSWQVEICSGTFSGSSGRLSGKGFATWNSCSWNVIAMQMEGTREETHNNGLLQVYLNNTGHQYMSTGNAYKCLWSRRTPVILHPILHRDAPPQRVHSSCQLRVSSLLPIHIQSSSRLHLLLARTRTTITTTYSVLLVLLVPTSIVTGPSIVIQQQHHHHLRKGKQRDRDGHRTTDDINIISRKSHAISHWST